MDTWASQAKETRQVLPIDSGQQEENLSLRNFKNYAWTTKLVFIVHLVREFTLPMFPKYLPDNLANIS